MQGYNLYHKNQEKLLQSFKDKTVSKLEVGQGWLIEIQKPKGQKGSPDLRMQIEGNGLVRIYV